MPVASCADDVCVSLVPRHRDLVSASSLPLSLPGKRSLLVVHSVYTHLLTGTHSLISPAAAAAAVSLCWLIIISRDERRVRELAIVAV